MDPLHPSRTQRRLGAKFCPAAHQGGCLRSVQIACCFRWCGGSWLPAPSTPRAGTQDPTTALRRSRLAQIFCNRDTFSRTARPGVSPGKSGRVPRTGPGSRTQGSRPHSAHPTPIRLTVWADGKPQTVGANVRDRRTHSGLFLRATPTPAPNRSSARNFQKRVVSDGGALTLCALEWHRLAPALLKV